MIIAGPILTSETIPSYLRSFLANILEANLNSAVHGHGQQSYNLPNKIYRYPPFLPAYGHINLIHMSYTLRI